MLNVVNLFAALGVLLSTPVVYRVALFLWFYLLRPSAVRSHLHRPAPYAIVTGATDGIGKAVAEALFDKGFNLILHGRNQVKMRKVVESIRATGPHDVRCFIADASQPGLDFAGIVEPFKDLNITLVVHNVGGSYFSRERIDGVDESTLLGVVHMNAIFPVLLTRALLPSLRTAAEHGPATVLFVGSLAADLCPPHLALYSASKAFLRALARGLDIDERVWGAQSGVRFEYLAVGKVRSQSVRAAVGFDTPTAERFARALVGQAGCGWKQYAPYWPHAVVQWAVDVLGERFLEKYNAWVTDELFTTREKDA